MSYLRLSGPANRTSARVVGVALTGAGLLGAAMVTFAFGGSQTAFPHLFYLPILFAAVRWGILTGVSAAVAATVLCGPLMPLDVQAGVPQTIANWSTRGAFFVLAGAFVGLLVRRVREAARRETILAERERDLAVQREAIVQTVSHEIRTPLTIIKGVAEMFKREGMVSERARPLVAGLGRAVARFEEIANMMLAVTEAGEVAEVHAVPCTMDEILSDTLSLLPARANPGRVAVGGEALHVVVETVPEYLKLMLRSLIDNALRFSPADSPVDVAVTLKNSEELHIEIRDHGPGIAPAFQERAFTAFTQGDQTNTREAEGIGLGLYTSRRLVQRLQGSIELRPGEPTGTVAVLDVPVVCVADGRLPVG